MYRFIFIFFCLISINGYAQQETKRCLYRVKLTDKQNVGKLLRHPESYLSEKSIERRKRQGLAIDETDVPVSQEYIKLIEHTGVKVVSKSKWNNSVVVSSNDSDIVERLNTLECVSDVEKVWTERAAKVSLRPMVQSLTKTDTVMPGYYGAAQRQISMLKGDSLHAAGFTGKGVVIAIIDGGFMNADRIPSMQDINILGVRDFVATGLHQPFAEVDHGTSVLSCMAMKVPHVMVGTAPDASYWLLRSEDDHSESLVEEDYWVAAAEFADSVGADVISSSLGYYEFDDKSTSHRYYEQDGRTALISRAASMLCGKGIVHVNSAGNAGRGTWKKINFPGDAVEILTVGAVDSACLNTAFSSIGPSFDGRVKPDVMAMGSNTAVVDGTGKLTKANGTSFSCPTIAGMVACLWQAFPGKTAKEIIDIVRRSGDNYKTPDNVFGYGIPDFWRAYTNNK